MIRKQRESRWAHIERRRSVYEMSVRAKAVPRRVEYAKSCFPDTILKLLTCVKDIWSHLALHMIDDVAYIQREVNFGYQQFDFLMGLYRQHAHSYTTADQDMAHALSRLKAVQIPYYDITEIQAGKEYHHRTDARTNDEVRRGRRNLRDRNTAYRYCP